MTPYESTFHTAPPSFTLTLIVVCKLDCNENDYYQNNKGSQNKQIDVPRASMVHPDGQPTLSLQKLQSGENTAVIFWDAAVPLWYGN